MSDVTAAPRALPIGGIGHIGVGWWGAMCVIVTETALFGYLLFAYLYCAVITDGNWLPQKAPSLHFALPATLVLVASSGAVWWGERGLRRSARLQVCIGPIAAVLFGTAFAVLQTLEWRSKDFSWRTDAYGSMFFTITGMHLAHLLAGMLALLIVALWSVLGYFDVRHNAPVLIAAAYWHFVVAVGVAVFFVLYLSPYLLVAG